MEIDFTRIRGGGILSGIEPTVDVINSTEGANSLFTPDPEVPPSFIGSDLRAFLTRVNFRPDEVSDLSTNIINDPTALIIMSPYRGAISGVVQGKEVEDPSYGKVFAIGIFAFTDDIFGPNNLKLVLDKLKQVVQENNPECKHLMFRINTNKNVGDKDFIKSIPNEDVNYKKVENVENGTITVYIPI